MDNATHTPGPWEASNWRVCAFPNGGIVVICDTANNKQSRTAENKANAHLIAAAPDLLAALKAFDEGLRNGSIRFAKKRQSDSDPYHPANVLMCEAFAKVEGRATHRGCGMCGSTALPDSKLCAVCAGVDRGPSPEALARECAAAVAGRKLGDMPQVSRTGVPANVIEVSAKGMSLGSILVPNIPHHPPADPTDVTTLTGEEEDDKALTPEEVQNLKVAAHAAGLLIEVVTDDDEAVTGDEF